VIYVTRSVKFEENEEIVSEILDRYPAELEYVLPQFANDQCEDYEFVECLKLDPSDFGNGIFITCFRVLRPEYINQNEEQPEDNELEEEEDNEKVSRQVKLKKKKRSQSMQLNSTPSLAHLDSSDALVEKTKRRISTWSLYGSNKSISNLKLNEPTPNLWVYGVSLAKFYPGYNPKKTVARKYPVPNPIVWK
jgi:hypothetical protein